MALIHWQNLKDAGRSASLKTTQYCQIFNEVESTFQNSAVILEYVLYILMLKVCTSLKSNLDV